MIFSLCHRPFIRVERGSACREQFGWAGSKQHRLIYMVDAARASRFFEVRSTGTESEVFSGFVCVRIRTSGGDARPSHAIMLRRLKYQWALADD